MKYTTLSENAKQILLNAVADIEERANRPSNKPRLKGVRGLNFDMNDWLWINGESVCTLNELYANPVTADCGGSCCFFGDIVLRNKPQIKALKLDADDRDGDIYISSAVEALLGITGIEASLLYDYSEWPRPFKEIYETGSQQADQKLMAYALRRTVEQFIAERS